MSQPSLTLDIAPAPPMPWSGRLSELLTVLTIEAAEQPERWSKRLLKHGALVALQLEAGRRVVRIARPEAPADARARERWEFELGTFVKHLGITGWPRSADPDAGGVAVRYVELWPGETAPGKAACMDCGTEIPFDHVYGGRDRCQRCAIRAGRSGP